MRKVAINLECTFCGTVLSSQCVRKPFSRAIYFSAPQGFRNSLSDMKDIGILQVKVLKAVDLLAADFSGIKRFHFSFIFLCISYFEMIL